ncbi:MAG: GAF domain-containing protein, partial [Chloroflexota bacterium]|nr:GAF domain-containing protein [Chloroflexota bacterium]
LLENNSHHLLCDHYRYVYYLEPFPLGKGLTSKIIQTRKPLLLGSLDEQTANGAFTPPEALTNSSGVIAPSFLGAPIIVGDKVLGTVHLSVYQPNAFDENHVRLLETLASNMGVAIQNARLFEAEQERVAELQIINSIQQGLASKLDFQSIIDLVGEQVRAITKAYSVFIAIYDKATELVSWPYWVNDDERIDSRTEPLRKNITRRVLFATAPLNLGTEEEILAHDAIPPEGYTSVGKSFLGVPFSVGDAMLGALSIHAVEQEHAFTESDARLLQTLANSMSVALENARLFDETQRLLKETEQRAAELAIINSVQDGLAKKLDFQEIVDLLGEKIGEIFAADTVSVSMYDAERDWAVNWYYVDRRQRIPFADAPIARPSLTEIMIDTHEPLLIGSREEAEKLGSVRISRDGEEKDKNEAFLGVPILTDKKVIGAVSVQSYQQHAFNQNDLRLLQTLANSMSIALENARLFDETQRLLKETEQRAAELAIINSVQQALAAKLDMKGIYTTVGEKLREIFSAQAITIYSGNLKTQLETMEYSFEKGQKLERITEPLNSLYEYVLGLNKTFVRNKDFPQFAAQFKDYVILQGEVPISVINTPVIRNEGDGYYLNVSIMDMDGEKTFDESDVRLLETLASAMSVALENARLFDETQQRNAELAIINAVQRALAAELDIRGIYDAVGEKLREIFHAQTISIYSASFKKRVTTVEYNFEKGQKFDSISVPFNSLHESIIESDEPLVRNGDFPQFAAQFKDYKVPAGEIPLSVMSTTVYRNKEADTWVGVSIQDMDGKRTFEESDVRLLETVAGAMSVALQNARLFDETQRLLKETEERNAELAVINSVQQGLASKLDFQGIIDLIGEQVREIFDAQATLISLYSPHTREIDHRYFIERDKRLHIDQPVPIDKFRERVVETHQPWLINQGYLEVAAEIGEETVLEGEEPRSLLFAPMIVGDNVTGIISLQNLDRENAFGESDVRLLSTIANSMSVALENARLFEETQRLLNETNQRAAELAILNSAGEAMAKTLDMKTVTRSVGDKVRTIFNAEIADILLYDPKSGMVHLTYSYSGGYFDDEPPWGLSEGGLTSRIILTRQPLLLRSAHEMDENGAAAYVTAPTDTEDVQSYLGVPIMIGDKVLGVVDVQSVRLNAFDENNLRLLQTLSANLGVALENARLFNETQRLLKETEQRATELSAISTVSQALVAETELDNMIQLIGSQMHEIFKADIVYVALLDQQTNLIHFPYHAGES